MPLLPSGNCKSSLIWSSNKIPTTAAEMVDAITLNHIENIRFCESCLRPFKGERKQLIPVEHYDRKDRSKLDHYQKYFQKLFDTFSLISSSRMII